MFTHTPGLSERHLVNLILPASRLLGTTCSCHFGLDFLVNVQHTYLLSIVVIRGLLAK